MSVGNTFDRRSSKTRKNSVGQTGAFNRPRRFSLLYSSSDDEDADDDDVQLSLKQRRKSKTVSKPSAGTSTNNKNEMKIVALRNKLKLLQTAKGGNSSNKNINKDFTSDHLIANTSKNSSLQSTVKKRKQQQNNLISSSSSSDDYDENANDETSSEDERQIHPFSLKNKPQEKLLDLKTISDLSDPSPTPEPSKTGDDEEPKSASVSSDEINETELMNAISSDSDIEREEEDLIVDDDLSISLDLDLSLDGEKIDGKSNSNSLEMFSNVAADPSSNNQSEIYVVEDDDDDNNDELDINLGKDNSIVDDEDDEDDDEDYDEMLLEAALITDSEGNTDHLIPNALSGNDDAEDSNDNVFINVDDLDPHSFYFDHEVDDDEEDGYSDENTAKNPFFQDEESTDEDEALPEISNKIKTRTRSIHNMHDSAFGKNLPKLNCWKADGRRPFSIIDGLSTKSLYSIAVDDEDDDSSSSNENNSKNIRGNLLTPVVNAAYSLDINNSLLNARANINDQLLKEDTSNDTTPKLRNRRNSIHKTSTDVHDFPMDQLIAITSNSNDDDEEEDESFSDIETGKNSSRLPPSATNSTEEIQMVIHKDKKDIDDGNEDLFTENGLNALMNNELIIEFSNHAESNKLDLYRRNSVSSFQNQKYNGNKSKLATADCALIQQLTKQQPQDPLTGSSKSRRGSVIMEEAKEGNLRYTKFGLFSEAAMMNLEEFINTNTANSGEVQFEVDGLSFN